MDQVQKNEVEKSYHLMYKHIAEEFVHWDDLKLILQNGNLLVTTVVNTVLAGVASPPDFVLKGTGAGSGNQVSTQFVYQEKAQGLGRIAQHEAQAKGLAAAQEGITAGVETALGA
jgi:hypothetical protein